jgi:virginiamycin B lyase
VAIAISLFLGTAAASSPAFAAAGQVKEFKIPPPGGAPQGITVGPDGALWFTEVATGGIGRLGPGGFTNFVEGGNPDSIVTGPDGALWYTDLSAGLIGRLTTDGQSADFTLPPCPTCSPYGQGATSITVGPDGALWYARPAASTIGRITTDGQITEFPVGAAEGSASWITAGPDGALYFADDTGVGRITITGTTSQVWSGLNYPSSITTGPDRNLWVTGSSQDVVGRVTLAGQATLFSLTLNCDPQQIAPGAGALWVTCYNLNAIHRVTTSGVVTAFPVPGHIPNYPDVMYGIVQGPGGALWFTEYAGVRIGRISTR